MYHHLATLNNPIDTLDTRMVAVERLLISHGFQLENPQSVEDVKGGGHR